VEHSSDPTFFDKQKSSMSWPSSVNTTSSPYTKRQRFAPAVSDALANAVFVSELRADSSRREALVADKRQRHARALPQLRATLRAVT
jgi:hypothetical protein